MIKIIKSGYRKIYYHLPVMIRGMVSGNLYRWGIKPTVNKHVRSPFNRVMVTLSADFEMAWAFRFSKKSGNDAESIGLQERENVPEIIRQLDHYHIPVTWATVGHLFLEGCKRENGLPHSNMPRPDFFENKNWRFQEGDWYQHDPCSNYKEAPAWYAPDLVDMIMYAKAGHEIGCHTFSHTDFTYRNCSESLALAEIKECKKHAVERGVVLRSMVFAGGAAGNYETLKEEGFICYRYNGVYDIDIPFIDRFGLVAFPSSYCLGERGYNWNAATCFDVVKSHIAKAISYNSTCHLWFHPSMSPWYLKQVFPQLMKYLAELRDAGKIDILTMGEAAVKLKNSQKIVE